MGKHRKRLAYLAVDDLTRPAVVTLGFYETTFAFWCPRTRKVVKFGDFEQAIHSARNCAVEHENDWVAHQLNRRP